MAHSVEPEMQNIYVKSYNVIGKTTPLFESVCIYCNSFRILRSDIDFTRTSPFFFFFRCFFFVVLELKFGCDEGLRVHYYHDASPFTSIWENFKDCLFQQEIDVTSFFFLFFLYKTKDLKGKYEMWSSNPQSLASGHAKKKKNGPAIWWKSSLSPLLNFWYLKEQQENYILYSHPLKKTNPIIKPLYYRKLFFDHSM